jgi:hypothetical protein
MVWQSSSHLFHFDAVVAVVADLMPSYDVIVLVTPKFVDRPSEVLLAVAVMLHAGDAIVHPAEAKADYGTEIFKML